MKIKITMTWVEEINLEDWPKNERSFDVIKSYYEQDYCMFIDSEPESLVIEQMEEAK